MFDSILFDLDGTLWDAVPQICAAWNLAIARSGHALPPLTVEQLFPCMGMLLPDIGRRLFPALGGEDRAALTALCCEIENDYLAQHGGTLYPGVAGEIPALARLYRLYIVSNCQEGYIEAFFDSTGLGDCFSGYESAGHTGRPKAENIRLVVEREGLKAPVYLGDTAMDAAAAHAAGVPFLHAAYGFGAPIPGETAVGSFSALSGLLDRTSLF